MKFRTFEFNIKGIKGICKSPSVWGYLADKNGVIPLVYFRKPGWMSNKQFQLLLSKMEISLPRDLDLSEPTSAFKPGDRVVTSKGCRIQGFPGVLIVIDPHRKWSTYDAVLCQKPDGSKRLFLTKNLRKLEDE